MGKQSRLTAKELADFIQKHGFQLVRQNGSHRIYRNERGMRITIPFHNSKILHPKIVKQALEAIYNSNTKGQ